MTVAVWFACAGSAAAETKTWTGGGGTWHTPENWSPAGVPSATDDAIIIAGSPAVSAANATVGSIDLTSGLAVSGGHAHHRWDGAVDDRGRRYVLLAHGTSAAMERGRWSAGAARGPSGVVENAGVLQVTAAASRRGITRGRPGRAAGGAGVGECDGGGLGAAGGGDGARD